MSKIQKALVNLFDRHRIIFWYDGKQELRKDYDSLELEGVTKVEIENNEFALKHRILREEPKQKFLLYKEGPEPEELDNWLLDVQLAHEQFRTDQSSIWLSELELGMEFVALVKENAPFFKIAKRRSALKQKLEKHDTLQMIRLKMLAICSGADVRVDGILEKLLEEHAQAKTTQFSLIEECGLADFLWQKLENQYGYTQDEKSLEDFTIELFKSCYIMGTEGQPNLSNEALVFLNRWKDSIRHQKSFRRLSNSCAGILAIEEDLQTRDSEDLVQLDHFELIDRKIIVTIVQGLDTQSLSAGECTHIIRQRRQSHWYPQFESIYQALEMGANFIYTLEALSMEMTSLQDGVEKYSSSWYKVDQLYRKFIYFLNQSGQTTLLDKLSTKVENLYSNEYLLKLGNKWQQYVDPMESWKIPGIGMQKDFFKNEVQSKLSTGKVFVIISDALRYEVADEIVSSIRQANKYNAEIKPCLSMLPSYTQLGMAALLPNKELEVIADKSTGVLVDGQSSQGRINREKQLKVSITKSSAVLAKDVLKYNRDKIRSLCRDNDLVYIYHDLIDHTGDKLVSEERVFNAAQKAIEELINLVTRIAGENYVANFLVTADHGFIYQNQPLDESDYLTDKFEKGEVVYYGRRFAYGDNLAARDSFKKFTSEQLGLSGSQDVLIPKSINRLRVQGSGSRFVHGGASLQEVITPIINITKKRSGDDIRHVNIDVLQSSSSLITSGQLSVTCYQSEPVTDKVQARTLRLGIYNNSGELISDSHELLFDFTFSNPRERELPVRLLLSQNADEANGQEVYLRLEEREKKTSHFKKYKEVRYMLRRSFTSDFDF